MDGRQRLELQRGEGVAARIGPTILHPEAIQRTRLIDHRWRCSR